MLQLRATLTFHLGRGEGPEPGGAQHLRRRRGDPAVPSPQGPQRHREAPEGAPRGSEDRAEAGMDAVRPREGAAALREPGEEVRRHLPRSGEVGPGGHARDADAHPPGDAVIKRASRNVTRWRNASMGLRWTAAGMPIAQQGLHRVNGHMHLPKLTVALGRIYEERAGRKSGRVASGPQRDARAA